MGFRVLLIAIKDKEPSQIQAEYCVAPTNKFEEIPEADVTAAKLPNGRYLLYINDKIMPDDSLFSKLSQSSSLVACYANETVMESFSCSWVNGSQVWAVFHNAQEGIKHLDFSGKLPGSFSTTKDKLFAEQKDQTDVDYIFDIPVELFVDCGGLRYDSDVEGEDDKPWHVMQRITSENETKPTENKWWKFW